MTLHRWSVVLLLAAACEPSQIPADLQTASRTDEIIGGVVEPSHWYVVMVGNSQGGSCTGTLISKRTVITAGHCRTGGGGSLSRVFFDTGNPLTRTTITTTSSVRHPQYSGAQENDLALVQLSQDAPVQPVPLLRETMVTAPPWIGPKYTFVGFGDTNPNGAGFGTRRVVRFPINLVGPSAVTHPGPVPQGSPTSIDASEWYYRVSGKNTCFGDSGGPAFVIRGGVERHAGATSFGDYACAYDGVQAKTDATTIGWIQQTIDTWEANQPCKSDGTCNATCVSTTPAPLGTMQDPDCADQHCSADGVCVLSCADADPDCASLSVPDCHENGICKAGCAPADVDCATGTAPQGTACVLGADCASGFCANNVCCDTACNGTCEACSAAGSCQPKAATTVCRAASGLCDVAETCTGTTGTCPADGFLPASTLCRAGTTPCDSAEACTGTSAACPADTFAPQTVVCRPPSGPCDAPETCTGSGSVCPADGMRAAGYICHGALGLCDVSEVCDGTTAACPNDVRVAPGTLCREAQGACDVEERCDGAAAQCPADAYAGMGTVCRAPFGACDAPEVCNGNTDLCPADALQPDGTACTGGACSAGVCTMTPVTTVPPVDAGPAVKADAGAEPPTPPRECGCSSIAELGWALAIALPLLRRRRA